ncbi:SRPBCC family protein [Methyloradius palustris]|uniref:Polyketide cyclase n=1 Tax=Methyloradius palustris TaxID=2778876 RepID=A0A8D5GFU2_9PROT|nr:SRPBCC family protein [Methyloradius palustris]BCM25959.1 polyketide cyclase [Methyloradius palustris]
MNKIALVMMTTALAMPMAAFAAKATTLSVDEKIEINAPASAVWAKANNFGDLGAWHPAVKKTEIVEGTNNKVGAVRLLTLQDDGTIKEKLNAYSDKNKSFKYQILEGVLPVSSYVSVFTVKDIAGGKSLVEWKGHFKRKDTSATPAAGQTDEDATKTIHAVYTGGLENLKKISETK